MTTFPTVSVNGTHRELGRAYGKQEKERIREASRGYVALIASFGGESQVVKFVHDLKDVLVERVPWILEELEGVAEGAGVSLVDLLVVNARSELISRLGGPVVECTSVAVGPKRSRDSRPRVAQNWDWLTVMESLPIILSAQPRGRPSYVTFCEAGQLAKIGVNSAGVAVGLNFLTTPVAERSEIGVPVHLILRAILAAESLDDALATILELPIGGAAHFLIADKAGTIMSTEVSPAQTRTREIPFSSSSDEILTHANDFELAEGLSKPCRSARLAKLLDGRKPDRETLFEVLRDHGDGAPERICSHPVSMLSSSTIASLVLEPAGSESDPSPTLWVARGTPCHGNAPTRYAPAEAST